MGRNASALKSIYSSESLREIALWAKACLDGKHGDLEFSRIQKTILQSRFHGFVFDFLTTSTIICDNNMLPADANVLCLDVAEALADGYEVVAQYDDMSPVSYCNSGRIIFSENIRPYSEWLDHPFYTQHCKKFEIGQSMTLSFQNPERLQTFLAFEYLGAKCNTTWGLITHSQLELASFPFALAWFYRKGFMDDAALDRRFQALEGLTEAQLTHIRKYVNSTDLSFQHQASELGISANWLKENLYNVRDTLAHKFDWDVRSSKKAQVSLRSLEREYRFFEMLGDPTDPLQLPFIPTNP